MSSLKMRRVGRTDGQWRVAYDHPLHDGEWSDELLACELCWEMFQGRVPVAECGSFICPRGAYECPKCGCEAAWPVEDPEDSPQETGGG